jgi:hypothetical protein
MQDSFTESDKQKVIDFLNMVATKAEFKMNTQDIIKFFKLLSTMQQEILPKIDKHILEVVSVHENEEK